MTIMTLKPRTTATGIEVTQNNQADILAFMRQHSTPRDMARFEQKAKENPNWCFTIGSWIVYDNGELLKLSRAEFEHRFDISHSVTQEV